MIGSFWLAAKVVLQHLKENSFCRKRYQKRKSPNNYVNMSETPKKPSNAIVKVCRCCNSPLANFYDCVDLFGRAAQKENIVGRLKEIGGIEVKEEDADFLPLKICRKCFRKISGFAKVVEVFRKVCANSKDSQTAHLQNARLKRGRKARSPTEELVKKRSQLTAMTQFTVRHYPCNSFNQTKTSLNLPRNESTDHVNGAVSTSEVRKSLFPDISLLLKHRNTNCLDIAPLPVDAKDSENTSNTEEKANQPQASQILRDAVLRNPEVCRNSALIFTHKEL